ncbi:MAG: WD40 repeat domain-containing protein [Cyanobacteria bacterium J06627_15]
MPPLGSREIGRSEQIPVIENLGWEWHSGAVTALEFSPDGEHFLSGDQDGRLLLWNREGQRIGLPISPPEKYPDTIQDAVFLPDSQSVFTADWDGKIRHWSLSGELLQEVVGHDDFPIYQIALSPNGRILASVSRDGRLRLWSTQHSLQLLAETPASDQEITTTTLPDGSQSTFYGDRVQQIAVAFHPNGQELVTVNDEGWIQRWNLSAQPIGNPFLGSYETIGSITYSADGQQLVYGDYDGWLCWVDLAGNQQHAVRADDNAVSQVVRSPDGQTYATVGGDDLLKLWDTEGNLFNTVVRWHEAATTAVDFSPDGSRIVTGDVYGNVRQWEADGTTPVWAPFDRLWVDSAIAHPNGETILGVRYSRLDAELQLLEITPDAEVRQQQHIPVGADILKTIATPTNVVTLHNDNRLKFWSWEGQLLHQTTAQERYAWFDIRLSNSEQEIVVWNHTALQRWTLNGEPVGSVIRVDEDHRLNAFEISPDGQTLVTASKGDGYQGAIELWNESGQRIARFPAPSFISALAFSADGQSLISGSEYGNLQRWTLDGSPIGETLEAHRGEIQRIITRADGIGMTYDSRTLRFWQPDSQPIGNPIPMPALSSEGTLSLIDNNQSLLIADYGIYVWPLFFSPDAALTADRYPATPIETIAPYQPPESTEPAESLFPSETVMNHIEADLEARTDWDRDNNLLPLRNSSYVTSSYPTTWQNTCLELSNTGETCEPRLVRGWHIEIGFGPRRPAYVYRTDLDGENIRFFDPAVNVPDGVRDRILQTAAADHSTPLESLTLKAIEPHRFSSCPGIIDLQNPCTAPVFLGWRAVVSDGAHQWVYHADHGVLDVQWKPAASLDNMLYTANLNYSDIVLNLGIPTLFTTVRIGGIEGEPLQIAELHTDRTLSQYEISTDGNIQNESSRVLSVAEFEQFQALLENTRLQDLHAMNYLAPEGGEQYAYYAVSDGIDIFYFDEYDNTALPSGLQTLIAAWEALR